jgi:uncharacterized membrane protein HdeD (DUF308 family)
MDTIDLAGAEIWWTLVLRGIAAMLFGVIAFVWPGISVAALVLLFGAFALVDGVFNIVDAFGHVSRRGRRWAAFFQGLAGIAAGLIAFFLPGLTMLALVSLIAAWSLLTGTFEIVAAIRLRKRLTNEWLLVLSGILSIMLGLILIVFPLAGLVALVWWIGAYAMVIGALFLALGFKLRRWERSPDAVVPRLA